MVYNHRKIAQKPPKPKFLPPPTSQNLISFMFVDQKEKVSVSTFFAFVSWCSNEAETCSTWAFFQYVTLFLNASKYCGSVLKNDFVVAVVLVLVLLFLWFNFCQICPVSTGLCSSKICLRLYKLELTRLEFICIVGEKIFYAVI